MHHLKSQTELRIKSSMEPSFQPPRLLCPLTCSHRKTIKFSVVSLLAEKLKGQPTALGTAFEPLLWALPSLHQPPLPSLLGFQKLCFLNTTGCFTTAVLPWGDLIPYQSKYLWALCWRLHFHLPGRREGLLGHTP